MAGLAILGASDAATATVLEPHGIPTVTANAPLAVVVSGFPAGRQVFVEQCDGVAPTSVTWLPTVDCDLGSSPAAAIADAGGRVTFAAADVNRAFRPFEGESPQSLFNCMATGHRPPANALPSFTNCKVRVSSNNTAATDDQVFFPIVLSGTSVPLPTTPSTAPSSHAAKESPTTAAGTAKRTGATAAPTTANAPEKVAAARAAGAGAAPPVAVLQAPARKRGGAGLLGFSDATLGVGYAFVIGGLLIAAAPKLFRRRGRARPETEPGYATRAAG